MVSGQARGAQGTEKHDYFKTGLCLPDGATWFESRVPRLVVCGGEHMSVNLYEMEGEIWCVFLFLGWGSDGSYGFSKGLCTTSFLNHCSWMLLICCCGSVFSHSPHSLAPVGYVWWGNSHSLILSCPLSNREVKTVSNLIVEDIWVVPRYLWKSRGVARAFMESPLTEGGGILAWVPVLSCIWCVVRPSLQPRSGGERLGWVAFAFPVPFWEDTLVSQWLTLSYQHCLGDGSSVIGQVKHELQRSSSESWTKPYLAFLDN